MKSMLVGTCQFPSIGFERPQKRLNHFPTMTTFFYSYDTASNTPSIQAADY